MPQFDIAEDPGKPPLVLVLQVGPGGELADPHDHLVPTGAHGAGDVEFVGEAGAGEHTDPRPVHPHAGLGLHAVEAQADLPVPHPFGGDVEGAAVVAGGVVDRGVGRVDGEGEVDVRVRRAAPTPVRRHDPVGGHVDLLGGGAQEGARRGLFRIVEGVGHARVVYEVPGAVEADRGLVGQPRARGAQGARRRGIRLGSDARVHFDTSIGSIAPLQAGPGSRLTRNSPLERTNPPNQPKEPPWNA